MTTITICILYTHAYIHEIIIVATYLNIYACMHACNCNAHKQTTHTHTHAVKRKFTFPFSLVAVSQISFIFSTSSKFILHIFLYYLSFLIQHFHSFGVFVQIKYTCLFCYVYVKFFSFFSHICVWCNVCNGNRHRAWTAYRVIYRNICMCCSVNTRYRLLCMYASVCH